MRKRRVGLKGMHKKLKGVSSESIKDYLCRRRNYYAGRDEETVAIQIFNMRALEDFINCFDLEDWLEYYSIEELIQMKEEADGNKEITG